MNSQNDSLSPSIAPQTANNQAIQPQSSENDRDQATANSADYIYELPAWDVMPPATFIIRRIRRL